MAVIATDIYGAGAASTNQMTSPSLSFSTDYLCVAEVFSTHASATPNEPTVSGAGRTWTKISTKLDASSRNRITLFRSMQAASSGAMTIDFGGQTQANAKYHFSEYGNVDTGGTNGSAAVVQVVENTNAGTQTGLTVTLAAFGSASNATSGSIIRSITTAATTGSGFSSLFASTIA